MNIVKRVSKYLINKLLSISGLYLFEVADLKKIDSGITDEMVYKSKNVEPIKLETSIELEIPKEAPEDILLDRAYSMSLYAMDDELRKHMEIEVSYNVHNHNLRKVKATLIILPKDTFK